MASYRFAWLLLLLLLLPVPGIGVDLLSGVSVV
jgi:hypothetical protein